MAWRCRYAVVPQNVRSLRRCSAPLGRRGIQAAGRQFQNSDDLAARNVMPLHDFFDARPSSKFSKTSDTGIRVSLNTPVVIEAAAGLFGQSSAKCVDLLLLTIVHQAVRNMGKTVNDSRNATDWGALLAGFAKLSLFSVRSSCVPVLVASTASSASRPLPPDSSPPNGPTLRPSSSLSPALSSSDTRRPRSAGSFHTLHPAAWTRITAEPACPIPPSPSICSPSGSPAPIRFTGYWSNSVDNCTFASESGSPTDLLHKRVRRSGDLPGKTVWEE